MAAISARETLSSSQSPFLRACRGEPVPYTPIWLMRQAGRTIPAYRALRETYGFLEVIGDPALMAEVTMLPMREMDLDAAVMFADIMLPLASLGVRFEIVESIGPVVDEPIRRRGQVDAMARIPIEESVPTVFEAIRILRRELEGRAPLIGFSGAPFTLASYLIEGRPSREYAKTKAIMFGAPEVWAALMERLTTLVIAYLRAQITAGVQAVQLFDSWIGALSAHDTRTYVLPYSKRIFAALDGSGVPRIHFGTGTAHMLDVMAEAGPDVVGVDWRIPLDDAWRAIGDLGIQGNLDPAVLLGPPELIETRARDVLRRADGRPGHVFNLGHGVLPDSPLDNIKRLVDFVHEETA
ncbi:MAG TPA: uroporphyrinogen decarboxylase [Actinomycetota bacterium]|nr:uroporphyrinogen decarboxylase [Actinomycetota bacterium]